MTETVKKRKMKFGDMARVEEYLGATTGAQTIDLGKFFLRIWNWGCTREP